MQGVAVVKLPANLSSRPLASETPLGKICQLPNMQWGVPDQAGDGPEPEVLPEVP